MVNLHEPVQVTIVDTVIDCPNVNRIRDVCTHLSRGVIEGHRVLHVQYNDPLPKDVQDLPHRGHGYSCDNSIVVSDECLALGKAESFKYRRYFNVQLVVEGNIYLPDLETCDYRIMDAMVMLVYTRIRPVAADSDRYELQPFNA